MIILERERLTNIAMKLENQKKRMELKEAKAKSERECTNHKLHKISELRWLITAKIASPEFSAFSSEYNQTNALSPSQIIQVKNKIMATVVTL